MSLARAAECLSKPGGRLMRGTLYALLSFFLFVLMNVSAKLLDGKFHVAELAFYRNIFGIVLTGGLIALRGGALFTLKSGRVIIVRAVIGLLSLIITFAAFQHLPLANAQTLLFTTSLMIPVAAWIVLGETFGPRRIVAVIAGFGGVCLIVGPSAEASILGVALALAAASCHTAIGVMLRHLSRSDAPLTVTFYFMLIGGILSGLAMPWIATKPDPASLPVLGLLIVSGTVAQLSLAYAYRDLQAGLMATLSYTSLLWACVLDWMVWGIKPTAPVLAGAAIIIASNLFILWREHQTREADIPAPPQPVTESAARSG